MRGREDPGASVGPHRTGVADDAGTAERRTQDYERHGTTNLYAALDIASGNVIANVTARHRAEEFRRFSNQIDKTVPADLDVHIVVDNMSSHKTPMIQRWLVKHPRFTFHLTPTSSRRMNLVERRSLNSPPSG